MEDELIHSEFEPNYETKFLTESVSNVRKGSIAYVYTKNSLTLLTNRLNDLKIDFKVKQVEDYWEVMLAKYKKEKEL